MAGLSSDQVDRLVADVYAHGTIDPARRRAVGPYCAVLVVLIYLRHNLSQALVAELFGCSQPTVSRLIGRLAPDHHHRAVRGRRPGGGPGVALPARVDGFLAPTGDRREGTYTSGMYSGKRHRCGFNIQVVGSAYGRLVLAGNPQPGAMHDAKAWRASGLAAIFAGRLHADDGPGGFADTAYTAPDCAGPAVGPTGRT
jgi:Helix-turn-helix of DDE superfamily endonuclease/DDE superfamily endonuclease